MGSREENLESFKKFWPENAPDISKVPKYVSKYKKEKIVIKRGGKVLIDPDLFNKFIEDIAILYKLGLTVIIIHGGGPKIKVELAKLNIESQFINGLRVTDKQTMVVVEKVLVDFNSEIIIYRKNFGSEKKDIIYKNLFNQIILDNEIIKINFDTKKINNIYKPIILEIKNLDKNKIQLINNIKLTLKNEFDLNNLKIIDSYKNCYFVK